MSLLLAEDASMIDFWKKLFNLKEAIYLAAKAWSMISNQNIVCSWRKLYLNAEELLHRNPASDDEEEDVQICSDSLFKMIESNNEFADVDEENLQQWLSVDSGLSGYELKTDDEIVASCSNECENLENSNSSSDKEGEEKAINGKRRIPLQVTLQSA